VTTTASAWVDRTRSRLVGSTVAERNKLAANYTAGDTTLTFTYDLNGIAKGTRLSIGLNTFYVWDINSTAKTATVTGGQDGTTDANATSGSVVWVRPRFTDAELLTAINEDLAALSSPQNGLFQIKTFDLTYDPVIVGYDLTAVTDLQDIYEVRYQTSGPEKDWPRIPKHLIRLDRSALTTDFASGSALKLLDGGQSGYDVRLIYKAPFTTLAALTTDVSTTGLPATAYDLPPLGAAITLMSGQEISRNFTDSQPDTRRATEVPSGARFNSYRGLMIQRQERIAAEAARLSQQYPLRVD